jgi:hypothetical protein
VALRQLELYDQAIDQIEIGLQYCPKDEELQNYYPKVLKNRDAKRGLYFQFEFFL